jgi:hypothetical protein
MVRTPNRVLRTDIDIHDEDVEGIGTVEDAIDYVGQRIAIRPSRERVT